MSPEEEQQELEQGDEPQYGSWQESDRRLREAWDAFFCEQREFMKSCEAFDRHIHEWQMGKLRERK